MAKTKQLPSILPDQLVNSFILVSGVPGVGKTTFSLSMEVTTRVAMIDMEGKNEDMIKAYTGLKYISPYNPKNLSETVEDVFSFINSIPVGERTTLFIDNFNDLEASILEYTVKHADAISQRYADLTAKAIMNNDYGARYRAMDKIIVEIFDAAKSRGITCKIFASLVQNVFQQAGKLEIKGRKPWLKMANLALVMFKSSTGGFADALIYKQSLDQVESLDYNNLTPKQIDDLTRGIIPVVNITRRLPPRIPDASAAKVRSYMFNPVGEHLSDDMIPTEAEIRAFSPLMTEAEMESFNRMMEENERQRQQEQEAVEQQQLQEYNQLLEDIKAMKGTPSPKIAQAMKEKYPNLADDITTPFINQNLK